MFNKIKCLVGFHKYHIEYYHNGFENINLYLCKNCSHFKYYKEKFIERKPNGDQVLSNIQFKAKQQNPSNAFTFSTNLTKK